MEKIVASVATNKESTDHMPNLRRKRLLHLSQPTRKAPTEAQCRSVLQPVHAKHHDHTSKRQNGHVFFWFHIQVINVKKRDCMCSRLLFRVCLICDAAEVVEAKKMRAVSAYVIHKLRNLKKQFMKPHQRLRIGECVRGAVLQTLSTTYFLRLLSNGRMKNIPYYKSNLPHTCTIYL